jgi:hypothetical protein
MGLAPTPTPTMQAFVMIDKDDYDSQVHVPKRDYDSILKKASEKDKPSFDRALFFYDILIEKLKTRPSIKPENLSEFLVTRRPEFVKDCQERFGVDPV